MREVPAWFVPFVRKVFGERNAAFWAACAEHGKVSPHPIWEFAADRVVCAADPGGGASFGRVAILGDAAHMASPRTGAGAYTAMVDAVAMGSAMVEAASLSEALELYNDDTVRRGQELHRSSRNAARDFAPSGLPVRSPEAVLQSLSQR
jgi:2-polyprenyl-6-methoxyphenol hydroxylase-like FAD-dependent oxidoreductase